MYELDRRTFLKRMGQGTAALGLGIGFSGKAWAAQPGGAQVQKVEDPGNPNWNDWEYYFPGVYDTEDTKKLQEFEAGLALINNKGNVDIDDLISGKLVGKPGIGTVKEITAELVERYATKDGANNPLWTDKSYAKKTKWGAMAMPFAAGEPMYMPMLSTIEGFCDYFVVTSHSDTINYYKPVYEGDTIYQVMVEQHFKDITPPQGSYYRTFATRGYAKLYNQKGELLAEGASTLKESYRRHKDHSKINPSQNKWEAPDWWTRPWLVYTDEDWEKIISIWKNETIRGSKTLYWDDVNIGDEPPPRAVGPVVCEEELEVIYSYNVPDWIINLKQTVLEDPKAFKKLVKNKWGVYVPPEHVEKKPITTESRQRWIGWDGRGHIQNAVCSKWAAGMIFNWMGDDVWLQRIGWHIMDYPPGSSKNINFQEDPTIIPSIPKECYPPLFDKYPDQNASFLDKVPYMRGCRAAWHALDGDLIISRAYVTDKYRQGNEYFVDLVFWCETLDKYLIEEGFMTVKLPKK